MPDNSCCCSCCGEKSSKPDTAMDHYITIAGNVKLRSFYLMTFDIKGHLRPPEVIFLQNAIFTIKYTASILDYNVSKYWLILKMTFIDIEVIQGYHLNCCRSRRNFFSCLTKGEKSSAKRDKNHFFKWFSSDPSSRYSIIIHYLQFNIL